MRPLEGYLAAARQHGEDSDPDHEVGDLQHILIAAWKLMTSEQKDAWKVAVAELEDDA